jgi:hypothetical protein
MKRHWSPWLVGALLAGTLAAAHPPSWALEQPPRWVNADDLRVRGGPALDQPVKGVLQRGAQVILKSPDAVDGFCLIEGDGQYGHVACQYLSAEPVPRPRAGQGGLPADRRWVTGTAVNLRAAPTRDAAVVSRLAIHRTVKLLKDDAGAGYCEVQPLDRAGQADGAAGYTACQYLGLEPLPGAQTSGADSDPVRAFWRSPGWWPLEAHAQELAKRLPDTEEAGPWPRDEPLEKMKAHLALGLKASPPGPLPDWSALKALAAAHEPGLLTDGERDKAYADKTLWRRWALAQQAAATIQGALRLDGPLHASGSSDGGGRVLRLMRALDLPTAQSSLFRSESDIGPPQEDAEKLAGRFGGIYRTLTSPRKRLQDAGEAAGAGLYDMVSRTVALTRPVQRVRLYRDGSLVSTPDNASATDVLWRSVDGPQCEGWAPGFAHGDVDGPIWRYFDQPGKGPSPSAKRTGPSLLFMFYARQAPPRAKATRSPGQIVKLDRASTGLVRVAHTSFDLDGDGQPDLLVLEGVGPGAGHLDGPTTTDDPWWRLLLANIGGAWKVLGTDTFSYGCGC